jgi:superfamily I DNA/RNA helicase
MRAAHRIKLAALQQWKIPGEYSHVLLDESHDLSKPILQILDVSPQAAISFGDEYQSLRRRAHSRANTIKRCLITHSVRSAKAIETIANPIIQAHPGETKDAFQGHGKYRAEVVYYSAPDIPARPAAILVKDVWELFDWAQRLASRNLTIRPLSDFAALGQLVADCMELCAHGTRPRHGALFRYHSWDDVRKAFGQHRSFQRMDQFLHSGAQHEHWDAITKRVVPRATNGYALGMIEDVRNLEFPDVMLAPNVVADLWSEDAKVRTEATSSVYVAVTRAQHRLFVPSSLREWIEARGSGSRAVRYP